MVVPLREPNHFCQFESAKTLNLFTFSCGEWKSGESQSQTAYLYGTWKGEGKTKWKWEIVNSEPSHKLKE